MLITIPNVLTAEQVAAGARRSWLAAEWVDGRVTAGYQAQEVKRNMQIPEGSPVAVALGEMVLSGLARSPLFMSAALPLRVFPPMFNSYAAGRRSARMWIRRSGSWRRPGRGFARIFRRRCF